MKHFIEQRIKNKCRTRKKERKTHEIQTTKNENWKENYSFIEDKDKNIDVRNENVRKIHKFIRGG